MSGTVDASQQTPGAGADIVSRYREGSSITTIADEEGVGPSVIRRQLERRGEPIRGPVAAARARARKAGRPEPAPRPLSLRPGTRGYLALSLLMEHQEGLTARQLAEKNEERATKAMVNRYSIVLTSAEAD